MTEVKMPDEKTQGEKRQKFWIQVSIGAVIGFVCGIFGARIIIRTLHPSDLILSIELLIAGGVASIYAFIGIFMLIGLLIPKKYGVKLLNVEDEEEFADQEKILWGSSFEMLAIAAALLLLLLSQPDGYFHPAIGFSAMAIAFISSVAISIKEWPHYDEMMRKLTIDSAYLTSTILFTIIWFWCSAAWVGWLSMPSPIILLALFMGIYLLSIFIVAGKMGLTEIR